MKQRLSWWALNNASGDRQSPETDHLRQSMNNPIRRPRIVQAPGQPLGDTQPPLNLRQKEEPAIRRQAAAVKTGQHGLPAHR
jgi:hypothetical protein